MSVIHPVGRGISARNSNLKSVYSCSSLWRWQDVQVSPSLYCQEVLQSLTGLEWHDKQYKKAHWGTALKANPFGGASHAKGIVLEKVGVEVKQPDSATRKCARVQLIKNGKEATAFVPSDGCLNFIEENDEVLVAVVLKFALRLLK